MAKQISLRDFQQALAQRLREAQTESEPASRLAAAAGGRHWLLRLEDAGEVLPVPDISSVPLTRPWYLGLANIRGTLASVVDFGAFMGAGPTARTPDCRIVLIAERSRSHSGLLIARLLGLRSVQALEAVNEEDGSAPDHPWVGAAYRDAEGRLWHELDIGALVASEDFLNVGI